VKWCDIYRNLSYNCSDAVPFAGEETPYEASIDTAGRFALLLLLCPKLNFHLDVFFCDGAGLEDVGAAPTGTAFNAASGIDHIKQ
jgi:hypothetical protein